MSEQQQSLEYCLKLWAEEQGYISPVYCKEPSKDIGGFYVEYIEYIDPKIDSGCIQVIDLAFVNAIPIADEGKYYDALVQIVTGIALDDDLAYERTNFDITMTVFALDEIHKADIKDRMLAILRSK